MLHVGKKFVVRTRKGVYSIGFGSILYFENDQRKIRLHTTIGQVEFYATFDEIMQRLDGRFLQCSRSYIVNQEHVAAMCLDGDYLVVMDNGEEIPLCKKVFLPARREFDDWLKNEEAGLMAGEH